MYGRSWIDVDAMGRSGRGVVMWKGIASMLARMRGPGPGPEITREGGVVFENENDRRGFGVYCIGTIVERVVRAAVFKRRIEAVRLDFSDVGPGARDGGSGSRSNFFSWVGVGRLDSCSVGGERG